MTQEAERLRYPCPVCHTIPGRLCVNQEGKEELEVHRERPYWSSRVNRMVLPHTAAEPATRQSEPTKAPQLKGFVTKLTPDPVLDRLIRADAGRTLYGKTKAIQTERHQQTITEDESTEIEQLRIRMPVLSRHNSDTEMLRWGQALARTERND